MKRTVLAILLAYAIAAGAQTPAPSQNPPAAGGANPSDQAPTIKDPAEYNAYVTALQQQDNNAKISALEAFLTQYPNSVMKTSALEQLMSTYQAAGNQAKVVDTAKRLSAADPNNLRALALLTFLARQAVMGQQDVPKNLADLQQYCAKGLDAVKADQKPAGMKAEDFAALQSKDYQHAQAYMKAAVDQDPKDLQNVYPLCTAYLSAAPPDSVDGLYCLAYAVSIAPAGSAAQTQIQKYFQSVYKNYHGSDEGADQVLATAKSSGPTPPAGFTIAKYVPPTPAQQAHDIVNGKTPDQIKQLSFGEWELVLSAGTPEDQAKVWDVIKNVPLQMEGNVIEATSNTEVHIAASQDDIEQKRPDITLTMTGPIPAARMPKPGDTFDFEGTPNAYTPTPFMMTMENGKLLKKAAEPAPKKPSAARRRPTTKRKPQ